MGSEPHTLGDVVRGLRDALTHLNETEARLLSIIEAVVLAPDSGRASLDQAVDELHERSHALHRDLSRCRVDLNLDRQPVTSRQELLAEIALVTDAWHRIGVLRVRLKSITRELSQGVFHSRHAARTAKLVSLRHRALSELEERAYASDGDLPWPSAPQRDWLAWMLQLEEPDAGHAHERLSGWLPAVLDLLTSLHPGEWKPDSANADSAAARLALRESDSASEVPLRVPAPSDSANEPPEAPLPSAGATQELSISLPATATPQEPHEPQAALTISTGSESGATASPIDDVPTSLNADMGSAETTKAEVDSIECAESAPASSNDETTDDESGARQAQSSSPEHATKNEVGDVVAALPDELRTFDAYRSAYWRDPHGHVVEVPWTTPGFRDRLIAAAEQCSSLEEWRYVYVHARAAEALNLRDLPRPRDIESLIGLLARPTSSSAGMDSSRARRLFDEDVYPAGTQGLRVAMVLEAWRPSADRTIDLDAVARLLFAAGFVTPELRVLLSAAFRFGAEGGDALAAVRASALRDEPPPQEDLEACADRARTELRSEHRNLWSAAGGRIETTHCREAWRRFMEVSHDVFEHLAGVRPSSRSVDLDSIEDLWNEYEKIADRGGARLGDRAKMDRWAKHLLQAAREVVLTQRRLATARQRRAPISPAAAALDQSFQALRASPPPLTRDPYRELILALTAAVPVAAIDEERALRLSFQDFVYSPALVQSMPVVPGGGADHFEAPPVSDAVAASAILMAPFSRSGHHSTPPLTLADVLREVERTDLLIHLNPVTDRDARESAAALTRMQLDAHRMADAVEEIAHTLDELAHGIAPGFRDVVAQARGSIAKPPHLAPPDLVAAWLRRVAQLGSDAIEQAVLAVRTRLSDLPHDRAALVEAALRDRRFVDALALMNGVPPPMGGGLRASLWRPDAETRYPDPLRALNQASPQSAALRREWARGLRGDDRDQDLRRAFSALVFDSLSRLEKAAITDRKNGESVVQCKLIREWMTRSGLNPSFIPQITQFVEIAVTLPPCLPSDDAFVRQTLAVVHRGATPRIVVVLAPRLSTTVRVTYLEEVRTRTPGAMFAIIDDLDVARLLNPGGQQTEPLLALLEIALEQQPRWSNVTPFEAREGQHAKPEMYVGRQEEAGDLATKATYSRVFSGRRLGKSALLKHVSDTHKTRRLSSRNALRVVYVGIVGEIDERKIVGRIEEELRAQLDLKVDATATAPSERLGQLVSQFLAPTAKESLLVFLDEADMFIEAQIRAYDTQQENSLSWRMRTNLESKRDAMDLPRVRFVFAGYRATQRREGAWANWGDVLRLRPLLPEEGARLIAGPLARLGIDASREASNIAFRCGYQPAVIIRFGQLLLAHLDEAVPRSGREHAVVTTAHVAHVFQNSALQQEIRTVVWNNFQGNPFGRIVFAALLLELARVPPGAELEDAPRRVWERLQTIVPDFLEGNSAKGAPLDRVARELRAFADRSLLIDVAQERNAFALLFPHHLPILLQEDQELTVRQEVESFGTQAIDEIETVRSLLPETAIDTLAYALSEGAVHGLRAAVAISHWPTMLTHRAADLVERLPGGADSCGDRTEVLALDASRLLDLGSATHQRPPLFVGGLDLWRWANRRLENVECVAVGRLERRRVQWWFERVRGITFEGSSPVGRFVELTGGVPFLLQLLDQELEQRVGFDGSTALMSAVTQAIDGFRAKLGAHVHQLVEGHDRLRLDRRELELIVMYSRANRDWGNDWPLVLKDWDDLGDSIPEPLRAFRPLDPTDDSAVKLLVACGLLPASALSVLETVLKRSNGVAAADPIHEMADFIAPWLST